MQLITIVQKKIDESFDSSRRHLGNFAGLPYDKVDSENISKKLGLKFHSTNTEGLTTEEIVTLNENKFNEQLIIADYNKSVNITFVGVCMDYSSVFKEVVNQLGIDCQEVSSVEGNHRWNIVRFADGSILHFDETQADQGLQQLYVLAEGLSSDSRIGDVVRNRSSGVKYSKERLYKLMGGTVEDLNMISNSKTVPTGDALTVFGSKKEWQKFHNAFHNGTQY